MESEKHIDESWKDDVAKGKDSGCCSAEGCGCQGDGCGESGCAGDCNDDACGHEQGEMQVNFFNYLMSMAYQVMIFLGEVPNPATGTSEKNIRQAKFLIDTLKLIQEKTKGNLSQEEDGFLTSSLYELQMKFVAVSAHKD